MKAKTSWPEVIVISRHEKGFLQADYYGEWSTDGLTDIGPPPDGFMTASISESRTGFADRVKEMWPGVDIAYAQGAQSDDEVIE